MLGLLSPSRLCTLASPGHDLTPHTSYSFSFCFTLACHDHGPLSNDLESVLLAPRVLYFLPESPQTTSPRHVLEAEGFCGNQHPHQPHLALSRLA